MAWPFRFPDLEFKAHGSSHAATRRVSRIRALTVPESSRAQGNIRIAATALVFILSGLLVWGLGTRSSLDPGLIYALLGPGLLLAILLSDKSAHDLPQVLALLDAVQENVRDGSDFFAALAVAGAELSPGSVKSAVRKSLARFDEQRSFKECLWPLHKGHPLLGELASDVLRAGWRSTRALELVLRRSNSRAVVAWERGRRCRVLKDRLSHRLWTTRVVFFGSLLACLALQWLPAVGVSNRLAISALNPISVPIEKLGTRSVHLPEALPDASFGIGVPGFEAVPLRFMATQQAGSCRISTGYPDGWVKLRAGPGMAESVVGYAAEDDVFALLAESGEADDAGTWRRVRNGVLLGWVYAPLCISQER